MPNVDMDHVTYSKGYTVTEHDCEHNEFNIYTSL